MKKLIIGIAGVKNSGKDTVASMINYILGVGVAKANASAWIAKRNIYDDKFRNRIFHYADPLKQVLSIIYNIPLQCFYDRNFKDNILYCFDTNTFITLEESIDGRKINREVVTHNELSMDKLSDIIATNKEEGVCTYIKLRTLMQYFGTDVCRRYLDTNIWIKSALNNIIDKANIFGYCIVPDVRFANEAIRIQEVSSPLYGQVIEVLRQSEMSDKHISELIELIPNYTINNDSTLTALFYQVLDKVQNIIENAN